MSHDGDAHGVPGYCAIHETPERIGQIDHDDGGDDVASGLSSDCDSYFYVYWQR